MTAWEAEVQAAPTVETLTDERRHTKQDASPFSLRNRCAPRAIIERSTSGTHRMINVDVIGRRNCTQHLAGGRIDRFEGLPRHGIGPGPVDKHLHGMSLTPPLQGPGKRTARNCPRLRRRPTPPSQLLTDRSLFVT